MLSASLVSTTVMLVALPYRHLALAILCLVPGALRLWSARSLTPLLDDPLLPERLLVHRRRNLYVLWIVLAVSPIVGGLESVSWTLPLTIVGRAAAGYPLRRALFGERWSFAGYLAGSARLLVALVGFRLLLAVTPALVSAAGAADWLAAIAMAALLLFWNDRSAGWFRFVLRATPLEDGPLLARFQQIAAASTAPMPRFDVVDQRGGALANAAALPSQRGSSVLYTDTLLRLLDADEAAAITAHEIGHLEHFDAARLRTLNRITVALILSASAAPLLARLVPGLSLLTLEVVWCALYVASLAWIARDRQRNETAADLRAVELCGDPDALVRALTKLHAFARVPRRWNTQMEHAASHPSLARRIRAIRGATGAVTAAAPVAPETLHSLDGRTLVTFADALHWQESEGVLHVLAYGQLTELRVDMQGRGGARLIALERSGRRWEAPLDAATAARAQAILDRVDGRLAEPAVRAHRIPWLQAAGAIVAISAMWAGQLVVALVAIGASMRSAAAFFAAAGAAALGAAALAAQQVIESGDRDGAWPVLLLAVFGAVLLAGAWRNRADEGGRLVNAGIATLAALALASVAAIAMRSPNAVRLYQASAALPSAAILPLALAAALAIRPRRVGQLAAIPICLVGLVIGAAGSGTFLHAFGRDPFLIAAPPLPIQALTGSPIAQVTLPGMLTDLRLSPHGKRMALTKYAGGPRQAPRFAVGAAGSEFTTIAATDLLFIDDDRALVMIDGTRSRLQELRLGSNAVVWEQAIDDLVAPRLAYRRGGNRWIVTGMDHDGRFVSIEGAGGSGETTRREWMLMDASNAGEVWAIDGHTALRAQRTFGFELGDVGAFDLTLSAVLDQMETRLTRVTPGGQTPVAVSQLDASCTDHGLGAERLVCMAYDGRRTHVLALAPAGDSPQPIGSIGGRFFSAHPAREGWLTGWTMTANGALSRPAQIAIDLVSRRLVTVPEGLRADEIAAAGQVVATVTHDGSSTHVQLYALER